MPHRSCISPARPPFILAATSVCIPPVKRFSKFHRRSLRQYKALEGKPTLWFERNVISNLFCASSLQTMKVTPVDQIFSALSGIWDLDPSQWRDLESCSRYRVFSQFLSLLSGRSCISTLGRRPGLLRELCFYLAMIEGSVLLVVKQRVQHLH